MKWRKFCKEPAEREKLNKERNETDKVVETENKQTPPQKGELDIRKEEAPHKGVVETRREMETKQVVKERNQSEQVVETGDKNYEMHIGRNKPEIMTENEPLPDKVVWKEQGDRERGEERHVVEKEVAPTRGRLSS